MTSGKNLAMESSPGGSWLYRQGELVLGPIAAAAIVEKLYAGELDAKSEVAVMGQSNFRRLGEVDAFKVHLAKAEAKLRVERAAQDERRRNARTRNTRVMAIAVVSAFIAAGVGAAAWYLAIHKPWADADELAFADISVDPPTIALASQRNGEELVDYPGGEGPGRKGERRPGTPKVPSPSTPRPGRPGPEEPDGLKTEMFDRTAIDSVVAGRKHSLYPCVQEAAKQHPGTVAQIPIEFVIGNDGRVTKVWVDNPDFKNGPLPECLLKELQKWPFKAYAGEQATVGLSFKFGHHKD